MPLRHSISSITQSLHRRLPTQQTKVKAQVRYYLTPRKWRVLDENERARNQANQDAKSADRLKRIRELDAAKQVTARTHVPAWSKNLPNGYTFYEHHNDLPVMPVPDHAKIYSSPIEAPPLPRMSVFHYLFPPVQKGKVQRWYNAPDPRAVAFVEALSGRRLYREEINVQAAWMSNGMRKVGMKRGDVVCIFGLNSIEWIGACFGSQATGCIVSPANYGYTPDELLHQLQDSGTKFIFVQPAILPVLQKALELGKESGYTLERPEDRIVLLCTPAEKPADSPYKCNEELWSKAARLTRLIDGGEKETAYLCYSSGTTGRAKGVETSHHNITSQIQALSKAYQKLGHQDRILGILPFGHIYGLTLLVHQPLTTCTPVIILPRYDEVQVLKAIQDYQISWALVVPPVLIALLHSPHFDKYNLSSLKGVQTGAAPCSKDLIDAFEAKFPKVTISAGYGIATVEKPSVRVTQGYGLTETSPVSHVMTADEGGQHPGSIGQIMPTFQARLIGTESGVDVEPGQPGELWLRGPSVMKGYWKNPEATNNAFAEGGWFKTGDVATVGKDGYFMIVDRVKELIKYKGFQVPPADLESLLLTHPRVADSGVIGIYSESQATELPRAYVVPRGGLAALSPDQQKELIAEIAHWIEGRVANHKRLRGGIVLMEAIPKSPSGKILRKDLRERAKKEVVDDVLGKRQAKL